MLFITIPTYLSLFRLLSTFLIILLLWLQLPIPAFILLFLAIISDGLDGWIARKYNLVSDLGAFIDHFADKVLVHIVLLFFVVEYNISAIAFGIFLVRDLLVLAVRHVATQKGFEISSMWLGKVKFVGQSVLLLVLVLAVIISSYSMWYLAQLILWISVVLAVISGIQILYKAIKLA